MNSMEAKHKLFDLERMLLEDPLLVEGIIYCFTAGHDHLKSEENYEIDSYDFRAIGEALLGVFKLNGRELDLLEMVSYKEVNNTVSESQLMREDSIFISILQSHIRLVGNRWLYKKIAAPVRRIISNLSAVSYEINPRKITEFESVELNLRHLKEAVLSILTPILKAPEAIPTEIVYMCKMLFTLTNKRFPGKGYRALASYLFLRFICPAIGAPETIGVVKFGHLKPIERRSLVLVAKIIQGVANEMPEQNEDYMQRLKEFIEENIQCLREFFDQVLVANVENIFSQASKRSYSLNHLLDDKRARKAVVKAQYLQKVYGFLERHYSVLNSGVFEGVVAKRIEFDITRQRCELLLLDRLDKSRKLSRADEAEIVSKIYHVLLVTRQSASPMALWTAMYQTLVLDGACLPSCHFYNLEPGPEPELRASVSGAKKSKKKRLSKKLKLKESADTIEEGEVEEEQREVSEKKEVPEKPGKPKIKPGKASKKGRILDDTTEGDEEDASVMDAEDSKSSRRSTKKKRKEAKKEKKEAKEKEREKKKNAPKMAPSPLQTLLSDAAKSPAPSLQPKKKSRGAFRSKLTRKKAPVPQRHAVIGGGHVSTSSVMEDGPRAVEFAGESSEE